MDFHELNVFGVEAEKTKIVDRVAIKRLNGHFFVVQKDGLGHHRSCGHHVTVGQDQTLFGIHDKARRGGVAGTQPIEGSGRIDPQDDHPAHDLVETLLPCIAGLAQSRCREQRCHECKFQPLSSGTANRSPEAFDLSHRRSARATRWGGSRATGKNHRGSSRDNSA